VRGRRTWGTPGAWLGRYAVHADMDMVCLSVSRLRCLNAWLLDSASVPQPLLVEGRLDAGQTGNLGLQDPGPPRPPHLVLPPPHDPTEEGAQIHVGFTGQTGGQAGGVAGGSNLDGWTMDGTGGTKSTTTLAHLSKLRLRDTATPATHPGTQNAGVGPVHLLFHEPLHASICFSMTRHVACMDAGRRGT